MQYTPKSSGESWSYDTKRIVKNFYEPKLPKLQDNNTLAELIDIALQNNPTTKKSWADARQAAGLYGESLAPYYPDVDADISYTREKATLNAEPLFINFLQTRITPELRITYTIFDFGKRASSSESARQTLFSADFTHNQQIQSVIQMVSQDYFDYLYQKDLLTADGIDIESAEAIFDAANEKLKAGAGSIGDVSQAKTELLQKKMAYVSQRQTVENSFTQLARDVGAPAQVPFGTDSFPCEVEVDPILETVDELVLRAQRERQDFLAAQANLRSKQEQLKHAQANYWPTLNSAFSMGKDWYGSQPNVTPEFHFSLLFKLSIPVFKGFHDKNAVRKAAAAVQEAEALVLESELTLMQQVTSAHMGINTAKEALDYSKQYVEAAVQNFEISLAQYKAGTTTILTVLSAQSSLADARAKLSLSKRNWYLSIVNLAYATGILDPSVVKHNYRRGNNMEVDACVP